MLKPAFQDACRKACEALARETADGGPAVLVGLPWLEDGKLYNAYVLLDGGLIQSVRFKVDLPNYGVFDEKRVFEPGPLPGPVVFRNHVRLGIPICEDIWGEEVVECIAETGGEILLVPNGSPFRRGVIEERLNVAVARVVESGLPMVYLNQLGGQDEFRLRGGLLRPQCRPQLRPPAAGLPRGDRDHAMGARAGRLALPARRGCLDRERRRGRLCRLRARPA